MLTSGAPARAAAAMSRAAAVAVAASRLVIILTAAAAAAAAPDAALADYFDIAERIWPDPESAAAKCLRVQRKEGWRTPLYGGRGPSARFDAAFKTLGVEGAGHHWLATLPLEACGAGSSRSVKRCGGLSSFSECGGCCDAMNKGKGIKYVKRKDVDYAWRCFEHDKPNYPRVFEGHHHIVLVRDPRSAFESVLRRFWRFRTHGGEVDTLAREETVFAASLNRLEAKVKRLDCRRTLFLEFDVARRAPRAHAAALSAFLGRPGLAAIAAWFGEAGDERNASAVATAGEEVDCVFSCVEPPRRASREDAQRTPFLLRGRASTEAPHRSRASSRGSPSSATTRPGSTAGTHRLTPAATRTWRRLPVCAATAPPTTVHARRPGSIEPGAAPRGSATSTISRRCRRRDLSRGAWTGLPAAEPRAGALETLAEEPSCKSCSVVHSLSEKLG